MESSGLRRHSTELLLRARKLRQQAEEARLRAAEKRKNAQAKVAALHHMNDLSAPAIERAKQGR